MFEKCLISYGERLQFFLKCKSDKTQLASFCIQGSYAWLWRFCWFFFLFFGAADWAQAIDPSLTEPQPRASLSCSNDCSFENMLTLALLFSHLKSVKFSGKNNYGRITPLITEKSPFPGSTLQTFCSNADPRMWFCLLSPPQYQVGTLTTYIVQLLTPVRVDGQGMSRCLDN